MIKRSILNQDIKILAIETSCDETSAAIVQNGRLVLSNIISSQIDIHKEYGGVVPEIASRKHVELIIPVIDQCIKQSSNSIEEITAIAVTSGPGLVGALMVGISAAKAICLALDKPLINVNHIAGHICANYIDHPELCPPFMCLVVSGGHSHIVLVEDYNTFKVVGRTRDDAAGEAFDKIARTLGLGYPGGPIVDKMAKLGDKDAIKFPRVFFNDSDGVYDFSFSGLKTAVINYVSQLKQKNQPLPVENICASFQNAVADVLVHNLVSAAKAFDISNIAMAGGVAANSWLRQTLSSVAANDGLRLYFPSHILCTDNAAMIAGAAYYKYLEGITASYNLSAVSNLKL